MNKYMHGNIKLALLVLTTFLTSLSYGQDQLLLDKVVAKVGSEIILLSDVESEFSYLKTSRPTVEEEQKCYLLESTITQKIIVYQAKLDSIEVSSEEVNQRLDLRFEDVLRKMNNDEVFFKDFYGATVDEMKDRYREDQRQKLLAERMQYSLIDQVTITPAEVEKFFYSFPTDSLPLLNSEVEISEIVIKPEINSEEREKALLEITSVQTALLEGEDFATLAKKHSDDIESGKRGGDLGFARRGMYVPEFEAAAFSLKEGERSEIIETEFGFHILELLERRGNSIKVRHILVSPEITYADEELAKEKLDTIRSLIVADSTTFEKAVKRYSLESMPSYSNGGKMKNPATGTNFFETKDLDPDTYFAIDELEVGGISDVMEVVNYKGDKLYRIIKLQSKTKPHRANLKQDYDKISYFAKESKKNEYFSTWLTNKVNETYVRVDPIYSQCPNLEKWVEKEIKP